MGNAIRKPQLIASDTNFLLDLANDNEVVWDCKTTIEQRLSDSCFVVTPTAIQELADLGESGSDSQQSLARKALAKLLREWRFQPINYLPVGHGIIEQIALRIRRAGLLPEEEVNDSLILAETALLPATILVSNDQHLKGIE